MAGQTEEFIDALKEAPKVSFIRSLFHQFIGNDLQIGDRTASANLTLDSKANDGSQINIKRNAVKLSGIGAMASNNDELIIQQIAQDDIRFILPANQNIVAKIGGVFHTIMTDISTEKMIREFRHTVQHDIVDHAKPTRAECLDAFKLLPHFDWKKDDDFYIKDTSGSKLVLIKYRAGAAVDEATAGTFHYEILTTAV